MRRAGIPLAPAALALLSLPLLALASCGNPAADQQAPAPEPQATAAPPAPSPPTAVSSLPAPASLAGEWRIAGIDGKDFNEPYGLGLSGDDMEIWWEPRCAGIGRGYAIKGNTVRFGWAASRGAQPKPGEQGLTPVCTIGLPERLAEVTRALDSATTIVRTPSNGIEISGGGHSLLLFSQ
jgi:hypothetical protein